MTDDPEDDGSGRGDKPVGPTPDTDPAPGDDELLEPGLVVEGDVEFDLGESDDVPSVGAREQREGIQDPEPRAIAEPAPESTAEVAVPNTDSRPEPERAGPESDRRGPEPDGDGPKKTRWRRRAVLGFVVVAAVLYVGGYLLTGIRMPAHASIGSVDVGGMSPSAARTAVDRALTPHAADPLVLRFGKSEFHTSPADAGLSLNLERTIAEAGGSRSWSPADIVGLFFGKHQSDPVLDVNNAKLSGVIGSISTAVNVDVIEPQITFPDGKPLARQPRPGLAVNRAETARAIRAAYLVSAQPINVPTVVAEPTVDAEALDAAMTSFAKPAVSGPVTIAVGDQRVSLPVTAYAPALVVRVEHARLTPYIDPRKLSGPLTSTTTGIGTKAVDATVRIENNQPVVVPGKPGVGLQPAEMAKELLPVLAKSGADRTVSIKAKVVDPQVTTADVKALKITQRISSFETQFPYAPYRNQNQGRAAQIINGTILKPGETFSFNKTVGERTVANGFTVGTVINGGVFREELGGGVSQVATTTYNAGFFGGMVDVEHHPHAFYINRYPVGREATVYWGALDLQFRNPTKYGVLIRAYVIPSTPSSAGRMHVELWSTKVWDIRAGLSARRHFRSAGTQYDGTDKCVPQGAIGGFDIDVYRYFYRPGSDVKVRSETTTAHYQAADHVICGKKP